MILKYVQELAMNLARLIEKSTFYWHENEENGRILPGFKVLRKEQVTEIEALVYEPVICLILQGRKETAIGDQSVDLGPGDVLLVSHDLPVTSRITSASPHAPYIAVILALDFGMVRGLYEQIVDMAVPETHSRSLAVGRAEPALLTALERYIDLLDSPLDVQVLGPAILREIHYRLLLSPAGKMLRALVFVDSHASRVAKAIGELRRNFRAPLRLPDLAKTAGMSTTSFHQHFKAVTGTTPLQYQKDLRLIAARTLLAGWGQTVTEVAFAVGYQSPTHFSRDYKRKFGKAPGSDTKDGVSMP
jgi:AraC-like DNA-binding protein